MLSTAVPSPRAAAESTISRWGGWLQRSRKQVMLDDDERLLHGVCDLADLEVRLQRLERGRDDRFRPLPPGL